MPQIHGMAASSSAHGDILGCLCLLILIGSYDNNDDDDDETTIYRATMDLREVTERFVERKT